MSQNITHHAVLSLIVCRGLTTRVCQGLLRSTILKLKYVGNPGILGNIIMALCTVSRHMTSVDSGHPRPLGSSCVRTKVGQTNIKWNESNPGYLSWHFSGADYVIKTTMMFIL